MNDEQRPSQGSLVQTDNRGLVARSSTLVRRGLETLQTQQPRIVRFPSDRSLGKLSLYDRMKNSVGLKWMIHVDQKSLAEARGNIEVPFGKQLILRVENRAKMDLSPLDFLEPWSLQQLNLSLTTVDDDELIHLRQLTSLQGLNLSNIRISNIGLFHLRSLNSLQWLDIQSTQISNEGLEHVGELVSLEELNLAFTKVSDNGIIQLSSLSHLQRLDLSDTQVTIAGLMILSKSIPQLQGLGLDGIQISNIQINRLKNLLPNCRIFRSSRTLLRHRK